MKKTFFVLLNFNSFNTFKNYNFILNDNKIKIPTIKTSVNNKIVIKKTIDNIINKGII